MADKSGSKIQMRPSFNKDKNSRENWNSRYVCHPKMQQHQYTFRITRAMYGYNKPLFRMKSWGFLFACLAVFQAIQLLQKLCWNILQSVKLCVGHFSPQEKQQILHFLVSLCAL